MAPNPRLVGPRIAFPFYPSTTTKLGWSSCSILSLSFPSSPFSSLPLSLRSFSLCPSCSSPGSSIVAWSIDEPCTVKHQPSPPVIKETVTLDLDCWLNLSTAIIRNVAVNTRPTRVREEERLAGTDREFRRTLTRNDETRREGGFNGMTNYAFTRRRRVDGACFADRSCSSWNFERIIRYYSVFKNHGQRKIFLIIKNWKKKNRST